MTAKQEQQWTKYGKSKRYHIWRKLDDKGALYNVTVLDLPPTTDAGYRNLAALLSLKNEYGGYAPTAANV